MNACAGNKRSHLQLAGESYTEHASVALSLSWTMFKVSVALAVHAMLPQRFPNYGSNHIVETYWFMNRRRTKREAAR